MPGVRQTEAGVVQTEAGVAQTELASRVEIDDFEDTPILGDWNNVDTGDSDATTASRYVQNGSQAVLFTGFEQVYLQNDSGRNYTKGEGTLYFYRNNASGGTDQSWYRFGAVDNNNSYFVDVDSNADELRIVKEVSGSTTTLASTTSLTIPGDDMVEIAVDWQDDGSGGSDITVSLTNITTSSAIDTLSATDGESSLKDNVYVGVVPQGISDSLGIDWISKEVA